MTTPALQTVLIDGVSVQVSEAAALAIARQNKMLADATAAALAAQEAIKTGAAEARRQLDAKDGEIAVLKAQHRAELEAKDREILALEGRVLDSSGIERRAALVTTVKAVVGDANLDTTGKSDVDLWKLAVEKVLSDEGKSMSDAGIEGAFLAIARNRGPVNDPIRDTFRGVVSFRGGPAPMPSQAQLADAGRALQEMKDRLANAWKPTVA